MFFLTVIIICNYVCLPSVKGGRLEKLWGVGGGGEGERSTKKSMQRKIELKNSYTTSTLDKKFLLTEKKYIPTREMLTKKFVQLENSLPPPPPHPNNFSNGLSLSINLTLCVLPKNVWERPC